MKRLILVLCLLVPGVAWAQSSSGVVTRQDTISSNGDYFDVPDTLLNGAWGSMKVQTLDSYLGTWEVQCSVDGVNFDTGSELRMSTADGNTVVTSVTDSVGIWDVHNATGCRAVRVISTAGFASSDTVIVVTAAQVGGGSGGGSADVGEVTISGDVAVSNFTTDGTAHVTGTTSLASAGFRRDDSTLDGIGAGCAVGDICAAAMSATGSVAVSLYNPATGAILTLASDVVPGTDTFTEAAESGVPAAVVRNDTLDSLVNTTNEYTTLAVDALGALWTRQIDPCSGIAKTTTPISITTDTVIVSALASNKTYICSLILVASAAEIVSITQGDTSVCGTNEVALMGSTTDASGLSLAANGGLVLGTGSATVIAGTVANDDICLNVSGTNRVSGSVTWVQAP